MSHPSFNELNLDADIEDELKADNLSRVNLNNNIRPVLLSVDTQIVGRLVFESLEALSENQQVLVPDTLFACQQDFAALCETEGCSIETDCIGFDLPEPIEGVYTIEDGNNDFGLLYEGFKNPHRFAFGDLSGPEPLFSGFSQPAVFIDQNTVLSEEDLEAYGQEVIVVEGEPDLNDDPAVKCELSGGYWFEEACWVLGATDQSCTDACQQFGEVNDMAGLSCDEGEWDDNQENYVCKGLVGEVASGANNFNYAPFFNNLQKECRYRVGGITDCNAIGPAPVNRVCKCSAN